MIAEILTGNDYGCNESIALRGFRFSCDPCIGFVFLGIICLSMCTVVNNEKNT